MKEALIVTSIHINPELNSAFAIWQAKFNGVIVSQLGFLSLEMLSPQGSTESNWKIVQRFAAPENTTSWRNSAERKELFDELSPLLFPGDPNAVKEIDPNSLNFQGGTTEVIISYVDLDKEKEFKQWISKIHEVEAKFPGFRGVYVQCPTEGQSKNWITFLQFDNAENLDRWLLSNERKGVLKESDSIVTSFESHRVISPYAGWFASVSTAGATPAVWKEAMIILLVLFPIVMLEMRFLNPWLQGLNPALATFIGNTISVALVTWPMVPLAIRFLNFWLLPRPEKALRNTVIGTLIVLGLYLLEIALLWNLLFRV